MRAAQDRHAAQHAARHLAPGTRHSTHHQAPSTQHRRDCRPLTDLSKSPARIAGMFDAIAARYDFLNHLLSAGIDRRWRRRAIASLGLKGGERVLDLCTGTADVALAAASVSPPPARVVGVDFSGAMLQVGMGKVRTARLGDRDRAGPRGCDADSRGRRVSGRCDDCVWHPQCRKRAGGLRRNAARGPARRAIGHSRVCRADAARCPRLVSLVLSLTSCRSSGACFRAIRALMVIYRPRLARSRRLLSS